MTNAANSPVEFIEREYPMTVLHYGLVASSGGDGEFRGGHGLSRGIRLDADATVTVHLDRTRHRPWGVNGGGEAQGSRVVVEDAAGRRELPGKSTTDLPRGTVLVVETAGGGGWGSPVRRRPAARDDDVRNQLQPFMSAAAE